MSIIDEVIEALMDKGFSEMGAYTFLTYRCLLPGLVIYDPTLIPFVMSEEAFEEMKQHQLQREQERRRKLAKEILIEIDYMRPQWGNPYAQY